MTDEELAVQDAESPEGAEAEETDLLSKLKETVDVKNEDIGSLRRKLTISIPHAVIQERLDLRFSDIAKEAQVPGFRKGRAPRRLLEKRFGKDVGEEVGNELITNGYLAATEKEEIKTLGDPMVWVTTRPDAKSGKTEEGEVKLVAITRAVEYIDLPEEGPLVFACEVELQPDVDLPELEGIPLKKPKVEITDKDVDEYVDRLRSTRGQYKPLEGGSVQPDDLCVVDVTVMVEGTELTKEENVPIAARPQVYSSVMLETLGDDLKGLKPGKSKTVTGKVAEDHEMESLRGKTAEVTFDLKEIKRFEQPPLDKAFIENLGFDSEKELRDWVRELLDAKLADMVRRDMKGQVYKYLLDNVKLDLPPDLTERQVGRIVNRRMIDLASQGVPEEEIQKHLDELKTVARNEAVNDLKVFFIMTKIAEGRDIHVAEDEIHGRIAAIAREQNRRFDRVRDDLSRTGALDALYLELRDEKIFDELIASAKIEEAEPPKPKKTTAKKTKSAKSTAKKQTKKDDLADAT